METEKTFAALTGEESIPQLQKILPPNSIMYSDPNPDVRRFLSEQAAMGIDVVVIYDDGMPYKDVNEADVLSFLSSQKSRGTQLIFVAGAEREPGDEFIRKLISAEVYDIVGPAAGPDALGGIEKAVQSPASYADCARWLEPEEAKKPRRGLASSIFGRRKPAQAADKTEKIDLPARSLGYVPKPKPSLNEEPAKAEPAAKPAAGGYMPSPRKAESAAPAVAPAASTEREDAGAAAYEPAPRTDPAAKPAAGAQPAQSARQTGDDAALARYGEMLRKCRSAKEPEMPAARPAEARPEDEGDREPLRREKDDEREEGASGRRKDAAEPSRPEPVAAVGDSFDAKLEAKFEALAKKLSESIEEDMAANLARAGIDPDLARLKHTMVVAGAADDDASAALAVECALWLAKAAPQEKVSCIFADADAHDALRRAAGDPAGPLEIAGVSFPCPGEKVPTRGRVVADLGWIGGNPDPEAWPGGRIDVKALAAPATPWSWQRCRELSAKLDATWTVACLPGQARPASALAKRLGAAGAVERPAPCGWAKGGPSDMSAVAAGMLPKDLSASVPRNPVAKPAGAQAAPAAGEERAEREPKPRWVALVKPDGSEAIEPVEAGPDLDALIESHKGWAHAKGATREQAMERRAAEMARRQARASAQVAAASQASAASQAGAAEVGL